MSETKYIRETPVLDRIGKVLHETFDDFRREPLPERWVDLLNRLNAEEDGRVPERKH